MAPFDSFFGKFLSRTFIAVEDGCKAGIPLDRRKKEFGRYRGNPVGSVKWLQNKKREIVLTKVSKNSPSSTGGDELQKIERLFCGAKCGIL